MKINILAILFLLSMGSLTMNAGAQVIEKDFEYKCGDVACQGYLAYNDLNSNVPGILIYHEWRGVGDYEKMRAKMLANLGYAALVVDVFGKGVRPKNDQEAAKQTAFYRANRPLMRQRAKAGLDEIRKMDFVDSGRIAAIGYCFGGTVALELARSGADIKGVVSFHGGLETPHPEDTKDLKAKILILHGALDPLVPAAQIASFENEMRSSGADWQMIYYGGAVHRFSNPMAGNNTGSGLAYDKQADERSWEAMKIFFKEIFQ